MTAPILRNLHICDAFAERDKRFLVLHTKNNGLATARNVGIQKATGCFLFFVDSDDWVEPHTIRKLMSAAVKTKAEIVIGRYYIEFVRRSICCRNNTEGIFFGQNAITAYTNGIIGDTVWNRLYQASCFSSLRFPDGHNFEDVYTTWKLIYNLSNNDGVVAVLDEKLYHFRMRKGSISHTKSLKNIVDMWNANLERYEGLYAYKEKMITGCIRSIGIMWLYYYGLSSEERMNASDLVNEMKNFSRKHFYQIMNGDYQYVIKMCCLFTQWKSTMWFCFFCGKVLSVFKNMKYGLFD